MVDIHTHILPMVDDGAKTMEDAVALLGMAWEDGIRGLILTPHYRGRFKADAQKIAEIFEDLVDVAGERYPGMALYLGNEVYYKEGVMGALEEGRIRSLNGSRYVLLEFDNVMLRNQILNGVSEVIRYGYTPIIAHLERYDLFQKDRELVELVLDMGALIQLNAGSVLGRNGLRTKWFCRGLLKKGQVHFIASDAHDPVRRTPLLGACFQLVQRKYGQALARQIFVSNPQAVISHDVL